MASPKLAALELTAEERQVLEGWARRRKTAQALALRSRIVLACAAGAANSKVAEDLGISRATVTKWRSRFAAARLEGLGDEPRPGAPRKITDEHVERVITRTLEERGPGEDTHWSTRSMAAATGMSQTAVSRIWRAFGLKPHLIETWKLSTDPLFIGKVRDIVGLYMDPPAKALVLCVGEKSQIQAYPGDDSGVCSRGQQADMTGSCSVADAISGVTPQRSERTQADGKDGCDLAVAGLAEPSQHPGLVVAASLTDATASGLPAQTLQPRPSSPDNQALDRTAPCLPILPTTPARRTHDYVRNGTASLFAAFETGSGSVIAQPYRQHRHQEFIRFLKLTGDAVPKDLDLHLVLDNYATHKTPEVQKWLLRHPRFQLHFTPASASWMNLVERWFAELTRRKLRRSAHRSVRELETDLRKWTNEWNKNPKPFMWTKTADDIFDTLAAYCERINDSGH